MSDIGNPKRIIEVVPEPIDVPEPVEVPERDKEKVPA